MVKNAVTLKRLFSFDDAPYLPDTKKDEIYNFGEISPELTKECRGLRIWLALKMTGIGCFISYLEEKLYLTKLLADGLSKIPGIEIISQPILSIFNFRLVLPDMEENALNNLNHHLLNTINGKKHVLLYTSKLGNLKIRCF